MDIATLSFPGMNKGPLTKLSSLLYYTNLTWTPTIDQLGYQAMCAMALDRFLSYRFKESFKLRCLFLLYLQSIYAVSSILFHILCHREWCRFMSWSDR